MARTADKDVFEKFRFLVTILGSSTQEIIVPSGGFTEVSSPKAVITEIKYRENIHGNSFIKKPGLTNYEPITLKKGAYAADKDLYLWLREVYNFAGALNSYQEGLGSFAIIPIQNSEFRRNIIISIVTRDGKTPKHWYLANAFPISYSPGDLNSSSDEKMISEIAIAYEGFVEVIADTIGQVEGIVLRDGEEALQKSVQQAIVGSATGLLGGFV